MVLVCNVSLHRSKTNYSADYPSVVCLIFTLAITQMARSEFTTFWMMILFSVVYTPYLVLMATMGTYQICYRYYHISLTL